MKKLIFVLILVFVMSFMLPSCETKNEIADPPYTSGDSTAESVQSITSDTASETTTDNAPDGITEEMAYNGVYNYCHSMYDWSVAEGNPDIMYVKMGEETESEYRVIFRSYTGSFVYFYVNKSSGTTRLIEYVPNLEIEEEAGTIELYDYLESDEK